MRSRRCLILATLTVIAALTAGAARADRLVTDISDDVIDITSNFRGTELLIFGTVQMDDFFRQDADRSQDIAVVVRGPEEPAVVRRKEKIAGIWVNRAAIEFAQVPGYYAVASSRPLTAIASEAVLESQQIGLPNLSATVTRAADEAEGQVFWDALLRQRAADNLYLSREGGVRFLAGTLFRTTLPFPANVPVGGYRVEVYLFQDGRIVSAQSSPLFIDKTGIERRLYILATETPLLYGLTAVFLAVFAGWAAAVAFRRQ